MNLKSATIVICLIAAIATLFIGVKMAESPFTVVALGFLAFAVSPYIHLIIMTKFVSRHASIVAVLILSIIAAIFGISALIDSQYINPDPQGGLAFIAIPVYQWGFLLIATLLMFLFSKFKNN